MNWINVDDKLPPSEQHILCFGGGKVFAGYMCSVSKNFFPLDGVFSIIVDYWMSYPSKPKYEQKN